MDDRSHFICSLSDGAAGRFEVMVDGKVSSSDELPRGSLIPAESTLFLGSIASGKRAILGRIGGLNIWGTVLEKHTIVALYRGNGREIGNVLSWFDLKDSIPEEFLPFTEALNLEEQHKGIS